MRLVVRSFSAADVGTYHCVSTNSLGRADGTMRLYGKCPRPPGLVENYSTSRCRNTKQTGHSGALTLHLTSMHHLLMIISSLQKVVPRTHEAVSCNSPRHSSLALPFCITFRVNVYHSSHAPNCIELRLEPPLKPKKTELSIL